MDGEFTHDEENRIYDVSRLRNGWNPRCSAGGHFRRHCALSRSRLTVCMNNARHCSTSEMLRKSSEGPKCLDARLRLVEPSCFEFRWLYRTNPCPRGLTEYTRFSSNECCDVGLSELEAMSALPGPRLRTDHACIDSSGQLPPQAGS